MPQSTRAVYIRMWIYICAIENIYITWSGSRANEGTKNRTTQPQKDKRELHYYCGTWAMTISSLERIKLDEELRSYDQVRRLWGRWGYGRRSGVGELSARDLKKKQATEMRSWPPYTRRTVARGETGRAADENVDADAHLSVVYMYIFVYIYTHTYIYACVHMCVRF